MNLDDGFLFALALNYEHFLLRAVLILVVCLLKLIQLSLPQRDRLNDRVFDISIKFIGKVAYLRIAKAYIRKIE